jgi:hypothetical protein
MTTNSILLDEICPQAAFYLGRVIGYARVCTEIHVCISEKNITP